MKSGVEEDLVSEAEGEEEGLLERIINIPIIIIISIIIVVHIKLSLLLFRAVKMLEKRGPGTRAHFQRGPEGPSVVNT